MRNYEIDFDFKLIVNLLIAKQLFIDDNTLNKSSNNVTKTNKKNKKNKKNQENDNDDDNKNKNKKISRNKSIEFDNVQKSNQNQFSTSQ